MSKGTVPLRRAPNKNNLKKFRNPLIGQHPNIGKVDGSFSGILRISNQDSIEIQQTDVIYKSRGYTLINDNNFTNITLQSFNDTNTISNNGNTDNVFMFTDYRYRHVFQVLAAIVLVFYFIVFIIVVINFKKLRNSFYTFVISLGILDMFSLLTNVIEFRTFDCVNREPNFWIYGFCVQVIWFSSVFNVLGLTISRFVVIMFHWKGEQFLSTKNISIGLLVIWLSAVAMAVPTQFPSQRTGIMDEQGRIYHWNLSFGYFLAENIASISSISLCFFLYFLMFLRTKIIREKATSGSNPSMTARRRSLHEKEEYKILLQSFILTTCMSLCYFNSYIFYFTKDMFTLYMFGKITIMLNYGINPFLYLIFSSQIRSLFFHQCSSTITSVVYRSDSNGTPLKYNAVLFKRLSSTKEVIAS